MVSLFGQFPAGGVLVNVVLVPLSSVPLARGMGSVALTPLGWADPLRLTLNTLGAVWLEGMAGLAGAAAGIPGMSWDVGWLHPACGSGATAGMLALLLLNAEARGWRALLLRPLAFLAVAWVALGRSGT